MGLDLTNQYVDETYQKLIQLSGSNQLTDGTGSLVTDLDINASTATSSSYALTASFALNSVPQVSASYATSASHALNADNSISSSYAVSATSSSYANTSTSASHALSADTSISSSFATTASYAVSSSQAENANTATSASYALTASYALNAGDWNGQYNGDAGITGSLEVKGDLIVSESKNLNVNGHNQFRYGAFYDTTTQSGSADTAHTFTFNTTQTLHASAGVTVVGGSQITYDNEGVYDNILETQVAKTDSGTDTVSVWIQKNGTDVVASRKQVTLSGNNAKQVVAFNWVQHVEVGDYIEILWSSPDANIQFQALGTDTTPTRPSVPSVYLNVNQVG